MLHEMIWWPCSEPFARFSGFGGNQRHHLQPQILLTNLAAQTLESVADSNYPLPSIDFPNNPSNPSNSHQQRVTNRNIITTTLQKAVHLQWTKPPSLSISLNNLSLQQLVNYGFPQTTNQPIHLQLQHFLSLLPHTQFGLNTFFEADPPQSVNRNFTAANVKLTGQALSLMTSKMGDAAIHLADGAETVKELWSRLYLQYHKKGWGAESILF